MITLELLSLIAVATAGASLTVALIALNARVSRLEDVAHTHELPAGAEQPETVSAPTPAGSTLDALRHEGRRQGVAEDGLPSATLALARLQLLLARVSTSGLVGAEQDVRDAAVELLLSLPLAEQRRLVFVPVDEVDEVDEEHVYLMSEGPEGRLRFGFDVRRPFPNFMTDELRTFHERPDVHSAVTVEKTFTVVGPGTAIVHSSSSPVGGVAVASASPVHPTVGAGADTPAPLPSVSAPIPARHHVNRSTK